MIDYEHEINLPDGTQIVLVGCENGLSLNITGVTDSNRHSVTTLHLNVFEIGQLSGCLAGWASQWVSEATQELLKDK